MWQWAFVSWKQAACTWSECNFLRLFMYEFLMWIFCFIPRNICQAKVLSVLCVCVRTCTNLLVLNTEVKKCYVFGCLHLGQWPMTYLITLSDWTMSCQPWLPVCHVLVTVSEQGTNTPPGLTESFIKSQNPMAYILSFVEWMQLKIFT